MNFIVINNLIENYSLVSVSFVGDSVDSVLSVSFVGDSVLVDASPEPAVSEL
tara:strand:- start:138 stop:293 length:156 start_codon:yes stop_codon:yes gene_type:complete